MGDFFYKKMLGGVANSGNAPTHWDVDKISEVAVGDGTVHKYTNRPFSIDGNTYHVWVYSQIPDEQYWNIMQWHRSAFKDDLLVRNKEVLRESMTAAKEYTNVIMLAGYAALFALLTQVSELTPATKLSAAFFLTISVGIFVALEVLGIAMRQRAVFAMAKAIGDPDSLELQLMTFSERTGELARKIVPVQFVAMWGAVLSGLAAFAILISGLMHGLWIQFLSYSLKAAGQ